MMAVVRGHTRSEPFEVVEGIERRWLHKATWVVRYRGWKVAAMICKRVPETAVGRGYTQIGRFGVVEESQKEAFHSMSWVLRCKGLLPVVSGCKGWKAVVILCRRIHRVIVGKARMWVGAFGVAEEIQLLYKAIGD